MMIVDFKQPDATDGWTESHSPQSNGTLTRTEQGWALFSGAVTVPPGEEARGAYAAVISPPLALDLSAYNGLRMWVRGDGGRYAFRLHAPNLLGLHFELKFVTQTRQWTTITLPFSAFKPVVAGPRWLWRVLPRVDAARIQACGLVFRDQRSGPFELEIEHITAYQVKPFLAHVPEEA